MTGDRATKIGLFLDFDFAKENVRIYHVDTGDEDSNGQSLLLTLEFADLRREDADPKLFEKIIFGTCAHFLHPEKAQTMSGPEWEQFLARLRREAELGDAEASLLVATALAQYSLISKNENLLDEAQAFYENAALKNSIRAKEYLSGPWQFVRNFYREKILGH